jgi:hypothetical protein
MHTSHLAMNFPKVNHAPFRLHALKQALPT